MAKINDPIHVRLKPFEIVLLFLLQKFNQSSTGMETLTLDLVDRFGNPFDDTVWPLTTTQLTRSHLRTKLNMIGGRMMMLGI